MNSNLLDVTISDPERVHLASGGEANRLKLSQLCDEVLEEFVQSRWYANNVFGGKLDAFERAMCKTLLGYLITQKTRLSPP